MTTTRRFKLVDSISVQWHRSANNMSLMVWNTIECSHYFLVSVTDKTHAWYQVPPDTVHIV